MDKTYTAVEETTTQVGSRTARIEENGKFYQYYSAPAWKFEGELRVRMLNILHEERDRGFTVTWSKLTFIDLY